MWAGEVEGLRKRYEGGSEVDVGGKWEADFVRMGKGKLKEG